MPSSISSFEPATADREPSAGRQHVAVILGLLLVTTAGIEAGARFGFARISRIERRTMTEHAAALQLRRSTSVRPVLLAGDSLLLLDVDIKLLAHTLHTSDPLQRFSIEQTTYLDWLFGFRRLFSEGSRPAVLLLCMAPNSWTSAGIRGDYSAFHLFKPDDIPAIAKRVNYDLTKESSLLFAHYSLFFAGRSNLRNFILTNTFPAYAGALHDLLTHPPPPETDEEFLRICQPRFQELERLCSDYGVHLIYVMPPGFGIHESAILEAGSRSGAAVIAPVHSDAWPQSKFIDGFHLNEAGAREFTEKVSFSLQPLLTSFHNEP